MKSAILLAAGFGTRLSPLTDVLPKCLMPINGHPLLEYWLHQLQTIGVSSCIVNLHYKSDLVTEWIRNSIYRDFVTLSYEDRILGTGGTLLRHSHVVDASGAMLVHADNLCITDFTTFVQSFLSKPPHVELSMMTFTTDEPESCGVVQLDKDGIVTEFYEKVDNPPTNLANGAVYIVSPQVVKKLKALDKEEIDFSTEILPHMVGKISTYHNSQVHLDIGSISRYISSQFLPNATADSFAPCSSWETLCKRHQIAPHFSSKLSESVPYPVIYIDGTEFNHELDSVISKIRHSYAAIASSGLFVVSGLADHISSQYILDTYGIRVIVLCPSFR